MPHVRDPGHSATAVRGEVLKDELRTKLEDVLANARARFGPIHWAQFKIFMTAFDRK